MAEQTERLVNVIDPDTGSVGSLPSNQLQDAVSQGYRPASIEEVQKFVNEQKYGTVGQQAITGLEGAASAATFGGSTALERAAGVDPEAIRARRETNPLTHMAGQAAGLVGSSLALPGGGAAGLLSRAGEASAEAVGLGAAETGLAKIGSGAVKAAAENAAFQSGDEVSKMVSSDPDQTVQTALTNIGLAGVLGAGIGGTVGAVNPLWQATMGGKVSQLLKGISDRAGGIEGAIPDSVREALETSGIHAAPEVRAALSKHPEMQHAFQVLQESSTKPGLEAQQSLKTFKSQLTDSVLGSLGKTPDDLERLVDLSENKAGENLKNQIIEDIKKHTDPLSERYDEIKDRFSKSPIYSQRMDEVADKISSMALDKGYQLSALSGEGAVVNQVLKEIPNVKNLEDLTKYQTLLNNAAKGKPELFDVVRSVRNILRDAESSIIEEQISATNPEMLDTFAKARGAYKANREFIDSLNDRLHVGKYGGIKTFLNNLSEMKPEEVLRRMSGKNDADLFQKYLLPEWENKIKDYQLSQVLRAASRRAAPGELINTKALLTSIEKMSPEMRDVVIGPEALEKINSVSTLMDSLPSKINNSGTAKALDALWEMVPASATGMIAFLMGHNPALALVAGALTKYLGRDVPDAARLALLKFFGSSKPIDAGGFKAMVDLIDHTMKGESILNKASKSIFKSGQEVLPQSFLPSEKKLNKLDSRLRELQLNSQPLLDTGGQMPHYLPDHGASMGTLASNSVNYLNSIRPSSPKQSPLDSEAPPSDMAKAKYMNALMIAEQPLSILAKIKSGTLTMEDVSHLQNLYPALKQRMDQKITQEMIGAGDKGLKVPYATRMSLSLFLGQALDSTMTPQAIMASQPKVQMPSPQMPEHRKVPQNALGKMAMSEMLPMQAREARHLK